MSKKVVSFHDDAPRQSAQTRYKQAIEQAKAAERQKPSNLENTPRFDQSTQWSSKDQQGNPTTDFLSPETKRGLEVMAKQAIAEASTASPESPQEHSSPTSTVEKAPEAQPLSKEEKLKIATEKRIKTPIDIGQYLMTGEVKQAVPIVPEKLIVTYRSVSDLEESYVDVLLSDDPDITNRQFMRKVNEYALASHIAEVNGKKWPPMTINGVIDDKAFKLRLKHVEKLSSPVFNLLSQNLGWFIARVNDALTAEAMGNG